MKKPRRPQDTSPTPPRTIDRTKLAEVTGGMLKMVNPMSPEPAS